MTRRILTILVIGIAALLGACGYPPVPPEKARSIRSIAIVTGFGERMEQTYVGNTVFSNVQSTTRLDWSLDQALKQRTAALLGPRYRIVEIGNRPDSRRIEPSFEELKLGDPAPVAAHLKSIVPPGAADAILFVGPWQREDGLEGSSELLTGVGLYAALPILYKTPIVVVCATYRLALYDGQANQRLAMNVPHMPGRGFLSTKPTWPARYVDWKWQADKYTELSPTQMAAFQRDVLELFDVTLPPALKEMGLR